MIQNPKNLSDALKMLNLAVKKIAELKQENKDLREENETMIEQIAILEKRLESI